MAAALAEAAAAAGATSAVHALWGATLYHPADLPSARQFRAAMGAQPARAARQQRQIRRGGDRRYPRPCMWRQ